MVTGLSVFAALDELVAMAQTALDEFSNTDDVEQLEKDLDKIGERAYQISGQVTTVKDAFRQLDSLS